MEWRNPDGNVVASSSSNFSNGGSEMALTFNSSTPSTRTDAGNWTCTVSVTGPNGEVLPLSPIVRTITVTVVGEYMESYTCSKCNKNRVYWLVSFMTHCIGLIVLEHPFSYRFCETSMDS